jgi:hypothetical protein
MKSKKGKTKQKMAIQSLSTLEKCAAINSAERIGGMRYIVILPIIQQTGLQ